MSKSTKEPAKLRLPTLLYKAQDDYPFTYVTARVVRETKDRATLENGAGGLYPMRIIVIEAQLRADRRQLGWGANYPWRASLQDAALDALFKLERSANSEKDQVVNETRQLAETKKKAARLSRELAAMKKLIKRSKFKTA